MGGDWTLENPNQVLEAQTQICNHSVAATRSMTLKCALELGIADAIHNHGGPMTIDELVAATSIQPSKTHCLHRMMTLLVHMGFFELHKKPGADDDEEGAYALTDMSSLLIENHPSCMRVSVLGQLDPVVFKTWDFTTAWLRNNDPTAYEMAHGDKMWDRWASDPDYNHILNESMAADSRLVCQVVLDRQRSVFEGLRSLVDVGGGTGTMTRAIASAFPGMECTVMDLPHVVASLEGTDNLKFVAGDMFQEIPPANAVMLKSVLHDWDDEESLKILKKCRGAIPPKEEGGKLIIIGMVVTDAPGEHKLRETQLCCDLGIMIDSMGKERNEKEWAWLFADAGFSGYKINPAIGLRSVIEVYP